MKNKEKEIMNKEKIVIDEQRSIFFFIMLILFVGLIILLILNAYGNYSQWKEHKDYFEKDKDMKIEGWMTPLTIERHFNIDEDEIFKIINISKSNPISMRPVEEICTLRNLNCTRVIEELNSLVR